VQVFCLVGIEPGFVVVLRQAQVVVKYLFHIIYMYVSRRLCGLGGKICGIGEIRERRNRCLFRRFRSHGAKIQILWRTCKG
jgi:hypothetical protein